LKAAALVCALTATVVAAGCGGSSESATSTAGTQAQTGTGSAGAAGGSEITIASAVPVTGQYFQAPEYKAGLEAAVASINAAGGVGGHRLKLDVCDTTFTANGEVACARKIVASKPDVLVAPFLVADASGAAWPIFAKAGLPAIGQQGGTPQEMNSPAAFLLGSGFVGPFAGTAAGIKRAGATNVAVLTDDPNPAGPVIDQLITGALKAQGITKVKSVIGHTSSDPSFATAAAQATGGGVDGVIINGSPTTAATMIKALRSGGYTGKIAIPSLLLPAQTIKALGALADGIVVDSAVAFPSDTGNPAVAKYLADMKAHAPNAALNDSSMQAWSGMELFARAAATAKATDAASLMTAFGAIEDPIDIGTSGPWSMGGVGKVKGFSRIVNPTVTFGTVKDGTVVADGDGFVNPLGA
jgi:ABC-type branched-subunit amino acid transport system substrate-binding protein